MVYIVVIHKICDREAGDDENGPKRSVIGELFIYFLRVFLILTKVL